METLAAAPRSPKTLGQTSFSLGIHMERRLEVGLQSQLQLPRRIAGSPAGASEGTHALKEIGMGFAGLSNSVTQDMWAIPQSPYQGGRV